MRLNFREGEYSESEEEVYSDGEEVFEVEEEPTVIEKHQELQTQEGFEADQQTSAKVDVGLRPMQQEMPKEEANPKDLRHLLRRTVSGADIVRGNTKQEAEKPKDLRLLLRRTKSGVSLSGETDAGKRLDARPQLRGFAPLLSEEPTLRNPSLSPRSPRDSMTKATKESRSSPSEDDLTPADKETSQKERARPQLRRIASGSDKEDDEKNNPRLQFRRTVSAPSLKIPNRDRKRLIQCTGKKRIHVREIEPIMGSLNPYDVYDGSK